MPKLNSEYPINMTLRLSVLQRDYLRDISEMHGCTPTEYVRALIMAEAQRLSAGDSVIAAELKREAATRG